MAKLKRPASRIRGALVAEPEPLWFKSWDQFRAFLLDYARCDRQRREQFLFRGHTSSAWGLQTTLDRERVFRGDRERDDFFRAILKEFWSEAITLGDFSSRFSQTVPLELLARHHGLPSPFLDWTESPYVAAYFAFAGVSRDTADEVAIWMLDRAKMPPFEGRRVQLIDEAESIQFNRRALQQRSRFLRVLTTEQPIERIIGDALTKLHLPASERGLALADLDEMTINSTYLFSDLDGAVRTVRTRLLGAKGNDNHGP